MEKIFVSIIIPVFNVEKYLHECLNSVVKQTMAEIEVICIDDASTDGSPQILEEYAKKDPRVKVIHQETNNGTLKARNAGVELANGEYILFLDSDDYIDENTCEILYKQARDCQADIVQFGVKVLNCGNISIGRIKGIEKYLATYVGTLYGKDIINASFKQGLFNTNLTMKLFKATVCKKAVSVMPDLKACMAEDLLAFFVIAYFSKSFVGLENANFYYYCYGRGLTGRAAIDVNIFEKYCSQAFVCDGLKEFLYQQGTFEEFEDIYQTIEKRLINHCLGSWRRLDFEERKKGLKLLEDNWGTERTLYLFMEDSLTPPAKVMPGTVVDIDGSPARNRVLQEFQQGKIGFRYIIKYFKAWLLFKLSKKK